MGELRGSDLSTVREQLGREPTTPFTVVARCADGHPLVIRNEPVDADGEPFPTLFWLTCPSAVKAVSRVESSGAIAELNARVGLDPVFADAVARAHQEYAQERARGFPQALAWGGVGGTRAGVKCLHAHYANHLAGGRDPVGAWVAELVEPVHEERDGRLAVVDQGTNSIRLLVVEPREDGGFAELARDMVITRLGEGVDRTGAISGQALARTGAVLATYVRRARALHAEEIRVAATSAVREASDRTAFELMVRVMSGSQPETIDGDREAELSFIGATRGLEAPAPFLVIDIGGGSTEFAMGDRAPEATLSTTMGSVRLTERFVRSDPPAPEQLRAAAREVADILAGVERTIPVRDARTLVAVSGTATTVQAIALGLERYDPEAIHRTWLSRSEAERVLGELVAMTVAERSALPVMAPGRGDVIVAGALVLVEVLRRFGFERALVSETDILDALALDGLASL